MNMETDPDDLQKMSELANWFEQRKNEIPNIDRLIHKLRNDQQLGHLVNAQFVKQFHEDGTFRVTDVEASTGDNDVDIELDHKINIQTWHGQSTAGHIMESQFDRKGMQRNVRLGNISPLGGINSDFDKDCQVMKKKLSQLPDDNFGMVLLLDRFVGMTIFPDWWDEISDNKCVVKLSYVSHDTGFDNVYGESVVYHSDNFQQMNKAKEIIKALKFNFKAENIP